MKNQNTQIIGRIRQLGLAALLATGLTTQAQPLYTSGHGDVRMSYDTSTSSLYLHYQLDYNSVVGGAPVGTFAGGPVSFAPDSIITYVPNPSIARPAGSQYDFLGNNAGDPVWLIPQVQDSAKPWLGFSSEDLSAANWVGGLQFSLIDAVTPAGGYFSLWNTGIFGAPSVFLDTADGIGADDVFNYALNTHAHYNWGFTQPGIYELTFKVVGNNVTDGLKEATATYTFAVGAVPEPSSAALILAGGGLLLAGYRRRRSK